ISRYGQNEFGGELIWKHQPDTDISGKTVLILDDIYDEGYTIEAVKDWCDSRGAKKVMCAVLVYKQHERGYAGTGADFAALTVPDRYVFGYGMDTEDRLRHLQAIYAFKET
ncbi:MAG: phosphoribosyltransferase family protein, partial [bacterium]